MPLRTEGTWTRPTRCSPEPLVPAPKAPSLSSTSRRACPLRIGIHLLDGRRAGARPTLPLRPRCPGAFPCGPPSWASARRGCTGRCGSQAMGPRPGTAPSTGSASCVVAHGRSVSPHHGQTLPSDKAESVDGHDAVGDMQALRCLGKGHASTTMLGKGTCKHYDAWERDMQALRYLGKGHAHYH